MAHSFRKPDHQIGFLIRSGYFNAVKSFFEPEDYYQSDIDYVVRRLNVRMTNLIVTSMQVVLGNDMKISS